VKTKIIKQLKGFTLIEILIAVALFSLLIFPILRIFELTGRGNIKTQNAIIATNLAERKIEEYRAIGFKRLKQGLDSKRALTGKAVFEVAEENPEGFELFKRFTRISYFPNPNPQMGVSKEAIAGWQRIQIEVEVQWTEKGSDILRKVRLFTIVTNRETFGFP